MVANLSIQVEFNVASSIIEEDLMIEGNISSSGAVSRHQMSRGWGCQRLR